MNIDMFQRVNQLRAKRWHGGNTDQWSLLEWCAALCGEAGEAANVAKKLKLLDNALPNREAGLSKDDRAVLEYKLAREIADTMIYALIILSQLDERASQVIASVFDQKSIDYGFPERAEWDLDGGDQCL